VTAAQPTRAEAARKEKDLSSSDQAARQKVAAANVDGGTLPSAPEPSSGRQDLRRFTPPLSSTSTQNRADLEVAPPTTSSSPQPPPSADDTKLATSGGFAKKVTSVTNKVGEGVKAAVKTVMDPTSPAKPPSSAQGFASSSLAAAPTKKPEAHGYRHALPQRVHWSITPEGKLVNSTDFSQWHEAYTQSPDIQFRVVVTEGSHVWAGGNRATLIHSWNGGVNWETLKVPDSGDITSISIDEDLQVKTSNGQTFVSTDHGQTWVPLQQPK